MAQLPPVIGRRQPVPLRSMASTSIAAMQQKLIQTSLTHVYTHGWTQDAIVAAAKDLQVPLTMIGLVTPSQLIQAFMHDCNERFKVQLSNKEWKNNDSCSDRIAHAIKCRLEMIVPYKANWHDGMALGAMPPNNIIVTQQQLREVAQIISDHVGAGPPPVAMIGALYVVTECHLLADTSPGHEETWNFLHRRVRDCVAVPDSWVVATTITTSLMGALASLAQPAVQSAVSSVVPTILHWMTPPTTKTNHVKGTSPADYEDLPPFPSAISGK